MFGKFFKTFLSVWFIIVLIFMLINWNDLSDDIKSINMLDENYNITDRVNDFRNSPLSFGRLFSKIKQFNNTDSAKDYLGVISQDLKDIRDYINGGLSLPIDESQGAISNTPVLDYYNDSTDSFFDKFRKGWYDFLSWFDDSYSTPSQVETNGFVKFLGYIGGFVPALISIIHLLIYLLMLLSSYALVVLTFFI